ncbi:hypothetical protein, partial [Paenibacillus odorifer]
SHVNTPPWTHYRQSVNYCPLFILASVFMAIAAMGSDSESKVGKSCVLGLLGPIMLSFPRHPRLTDSDDVIYVFFAFEAQFRTPVTLLH